MGRTTKNNKQGGVSKDPGVTVLGKGGNVSKEVIWVLMLKRWE